jgi:hypothetical protein
MANELKSEQKVQAVSLLCEDMGIRCPLEKISKSCIMGRRVIKPPP